MIRSLLTTSVAPLRVLRWNYVAPRLVLLFVLLCLSEVGVGWLAEWSLESRGSAAVGARVDIAGSKASLIKTRVTLTGIEVADPGAPTTNLFEADLLDLDFDTAAALRRRLVVKHGALQGLRFGGERTTSGALPGQSQPPDGGSTGGPPAWLGAAATEKAQRWIADLESRLSADAVDGLRSPAVAERLQAEWPERARSLRDSAGDLQGRIDRLEDMIRLAEQNPLRSLDAIRRAPAEVAELSREAARINQQIQALPRQAASDREELAAARRHDEQLIRERLELDELDPESISAYLLGEQINGPVGQLIGMLRWARNMMPAGEEAATHGPSRGVEVRFDGNRRRPDLLVERLDLSGSTRIGDRPIELAGLLTNFTTQPTLHGLPTEIRLAATGALPIEVRATLDRSGPEPRDKIVAACRALPIPPLRLGGAKWLSLESRPSTASLAMNLTIVGDTIDGDIRLVQEGFALRPADLQNASPADWSLADSLAGNLSRGSRVETTIDLSGDLHHPAYRFQSTLGAAVAKAVGESVRSVALSHAESLLASSRRKADEQIGKLDETIASIRSELGPRVREQAELLQRFAGAAAGGPFGRGGVLNLGARQSPPAR